MVVLARKQMPSEMRATGKLVSRMVDFDRLADHEDLAAVDHVFCALGTTMKQAGSQAAFRRVDHDHPLAVARLARAHGTPTYVLTSAIGADAGSRLFYNRVKGELERDLAAVGFESLTFARPGVIGGQREEFRLGERMLTATLDVMAPVLPRRWRPNPAPSIARELLEAAIQRPAGIHVVASDRMT